MYEKLLEYAEVSLSINPDDISPDSTFESLGLDSLDIAELIMSMEEELEIELELENENITTFKELADYLDSKYN